MKCIFKNDYTKLNIFSNKAPIVFLATKGTTVIAVLCDGP